MRTIIPYGIFWLTVLLATVPSTTAAPPYETDSLATPCCPIDEIVFERLKTLEIAPAHLCSDPVFVRRVYLDVSGTLPTTEEVRDFLADNDPEKRRRLINELLERDEHVDYWTMKWSDLLRVKAEFPVNLWPNATQAYHDWIRSSIRQNLPYDRFARELLTASGSNFRVPQVNFYRAMQDRNPVGIARTVGLTFMGTRVGQWPEEQLNDLALFFSRVQYKPTKEWKEEIIQFEVENTGSELRTRFPDGTAVQIPADTDPREVFADWLISENNPWFARNLVNRVWFWLVGRGIIHAPDDIRPDNPPSNPELLGLLEREFYRSGYDLKELYRLILNSSTYQQSCVCSSDDPAGPLNFGYYSVRRLEAELLIDALNQITGSTEVYSSAIPEPFTYLPEDIRSVAIPDGSITSPFLEMFGRPPRDTGFVEERNNRISAAQRLHLLNSSHVQRKIEQGPKLRPLLRFGRNPGDSVTELYLTILSRFPTDQELQTAVEYAQDSSTPAREKMIDLAWALINSTEFMYRH